MILVFIWLILVVSCPFSIGTDPFQGQDPNVAMLHASLESTVRKLRHCHLTGLNRGDFISLRSKGSLSQPKTRKYLDVWLSGDQLQFSVAVQPAENDPWWQSKLTESPTKPLSKTNVMLSDSNTICIRNKGDNILADIRPFRNKGDIGLYTVSNSIEERPYFCLPLLDLNRSWGTYRSTFYAINEIYLVDYSKWKIVSSKVLGQDSAEVVVEVPTKEELIYKPDQDPNKGIFTDQDNLFTLTYWKVWFEGNPSNGWFPRRIESQLKWRYRDKEFEFRRDDAKARIVFVADEWTNFGPGCSYPYFGFEEVYLSDEKVPDRNVYFRKIISELNQFGFSVDSRKLVLNNRREWKILNLHTIEPTNDLWIEPPDKAQVFQKETGKRTIQGESEAESLRILELVGSNQHSTFNIVRWTITATAIFLAIVVCTKLFFRKNAEV